MEEIDQKLDQWIYNSVVRAEVRELIVKEINKVIDRLEHLIAYYKLNTNQNG